MSGDPGRLPVPRSPVGSGEVSYDRTRSFVEQGRGFRGELALEREQIRSTLNAVEALERSSGGWAGVVAQLRGELATLDRLDDASARLISRVASDRTGLLLPITGGGKGADEAADILAANLTRRFMNLRVFGRLVHAEDHTLPRVPGDRWQAEAFAMTAEFFAEQARSPQSGFPNFWRFRDPDDPLALWLYHHHETQKYKCLFFRIEVTGGATLGLRLEAYVPFGLFGDPAEYEVAEMQAWRRSGWVAVNVVGTNYNTTNTLNLSQTVSEAHGVNIGRSYSDALTEGTNRSTARNRSETFGQGTSLGESTNWSENWGSSSGQHGGSSSSGGSRGGGTSYTSSTNFSETDGTTETEGSNRGRTRTEARNDGSSYNLSLATCQGISAAEQRGVQTSVYNVGIDLGKSYATHLEKWLAGHDNKARLAYTAVTRAFGQLRERLTSDLSLLASVGAHEPVDRAQVEVRLLALVLHEPTGGRVLLPEALEPPPGR